MGDSTTNRGSVPGRVAGLMFAYSAALEYLLDHGIDEKQAWMDATGLRSFRAVPHPPSVAVAVIQLSMLVRAESLGGTAQPVSTWRDGEETSIAPGFNARYAGAEFFPGFECQDLVQK